MRLNEIAERLAKHLPRDAAAIHVALRNPAMKAHLSGTPGPTEKSPTDFGTEELVRAGVLLLCQVCGLSASELAEVNRALNTPAAWLMDSPGGRTPPALEEMMRSVRAGKDNWHLSIRYILQPNGERVIDARLSRDEMTVTAQRAADAEWISRGDFTTGHLFVPLADIVRRLLES